MNGPVVARGPVSIKGKITGTGTIYAAGNVYMADDLAYANGPPTQRAARNDREPMQAWIDANVDRDRIGLFARRNIAVGDPTESSLRNVNNESAEDLGLDGIPNTRAGRDGTSARPTTRSSRATA